MSHFYNFSIACVFRDAVIADSAHFHSTLALTHIFVYSTRWKKKWGTLSVRVPYGDQSTNFALPVQLNNFYKHAQYNTRKHLAQITLSVLCLHPMLMSQYLLLFCFALSEYSHVNNTDKKTTKQHKCVTAQKQVSLANQSKTSLRRVPPQICKFIYLRSGRQRDSRVALSFFPCPPPHLE